MQTELKLAALTMAAARGNDPRGARSILRIADMQYAAGASSAKLTTGYVDQLAAIGAIASMSRTAWCYDNAIAAVVVLDVNSLAVIETASAERRTDFPYIPQLFSFRELPPILDALDKLDAMPDLIVCDGYGIAHPRRFGLASHLGVLLDLPTIGCAKSRLIGTHDELGTARGSQTPLVASGELVGAVLRTQTGVRPVFVSTGHRVSLETSCAWILRLTPRYRLPETTRAADHAVR